MPRTFDDVAKCVESTLARVGPHLVLAPQSRQEWLRQRLPVRELRAMI